MMMKKKKGHRALGQMEQNAKLDSASEITLSMTLYNETWKGVVQPMETEEMLSF